MPFLHTMIKYAADRGGLAGRVADVGLRAMKKRCVAVLTAALCLMLVLGLQACAGSGGGRPIQDPQAGTVLPEGAKKKKAWYWTPRTDSSSSVPQAAESMCSVWTAPRTW